MLFGMNPNILSQTVDFLIPNHMQCKKTLGRKRAIWAFYSFRICIFCPNHCGLKENIEKMGNTTVTEIWSNFPPRNPTQQAASLSDVWLRRNCCRSAIYPLLANIAGLTIFGTCRRNASVEITCTPPFRTKKICWRCQFATQRL